MSTAFEYALLHRGYDVSITSKLGEGGFGIVYAGVRLNDNAPIAVKYIYHKDVWRWHTVKQPFQSKIPMEIHMLKRVNKVDGTIKLYDWFKIEHGYVLVMERSIKSISLYSYMKTHVLNEKEIINIFKRLAQITYDCWVKCGIIHCDLKEANILINKETMAITILDLDFAVECSKRLRRTYAGTPLYAPPEWYINGIYYPESTVVWTLGVILWKLLFRKSPFKTTKDIRKFETLETIDPFETEKLLYSSNVISLLTSLMRKKINERPGIDVFHKLALSL